MASRRTIFDSVVYRDVHLSYYPSFGEIECDLTAVPGAELDRIGFSIEGTDASIDGAGNVALATADGTRTRRDARQMQPQRRRGTSTSSSLFVAMSVATGNLDALSNVPLKVASVTRQ